MVRAALRSFGEFIGIIDPPRTIDNIEPNFKMEDLYSQGIIYFPQELVKALAEPPGESAMARKQAREGIWGEVRGRYHLEEIENRGWRLPQAGEREISYFYKIYPPEIGFELKNVTRNDAIGLVY